MAQAANAASAAGSGGGPGGASGSFVGAPGPGDYATYDPGANIMVWHSGGMSASPDTTPWQMSQNRGSNHSFDFHFHKGGHDLSPSQIRQVARPACRGETAVQREKQPFLRADPERLRNVITQRLPADKPQGSRSPL